MKYLQQIIFYLFTRFNLTLNSFEDFLNQLDIETDDYLLGIDNIYLYGLQNWSYNGCLDCADARQLLEEHDCNLEDYLADTKDNNFLIISLVDYLGY